MPTCGIYKLSIIGDDDQERFYYGRSVDVERRIKRHMRELNAGSHRNVRVQRAYDRYGNITHSIVAACAESALPEIEGMFVHTHYQDPMCLNLDLVDPTGRVRLSSETRKRISAASTGRYFSPETREKLRLANLGKRPSEETRQKLSAARIGKTQNRETVEKRSAKLRGRKLSAQHRKKISDINSGMPRPLRRKGVVLTSPSGNVLRFDSLSAAAAHIGSPIGTLSRYLNGIVCWRNARKSTPLSGWTGHYIDKEES